MDDGSLDNAIAGATEQLETARVEFGPTSTQAIDAMKALNDLLWEAEDLGRGLRVRIELVDVLRETNRGSELGISLIHLGDTYWRRGEFDAALRHDEEALEILQSAGGSEETILDAQYRVVRDQITLGGLEAARGLAIDGAQRARAELPPESDARKALEYYEHLFGGLRLRVIPVSVAYRTNPQARGVESGPWSRPGPIRSIWQRLK